MESKIVSADFGKMENDFLFDESIRRLRMNLQVSGENVKVILFTSSIPKEGVVDISFQVAVSMANIEKKVLYIDANIRNSIFTKQYQIGDEFNGISQFLRGKLGKTKLIYGTNIKNLDVVFAGPSITNSTELLYKTCLDEFISGQKEIYDYIIIAAPSLEEAVDAAVIARLVDGAVIVVRSGKVSKKLVKSAKLQLEKAYCKVIGVVLNEVKINKKYYGKQVILKS